MTVLAADAGGGEGPLDRHTVVEYLNILDRLMVIEDQPAWAPHLRSRASLRTSPKRHFVDPSLAVAALGAAPERLLQDLNLLGLLFESLVIRDLRVFAHSLDGQVMHSPRQLRARRLGSTLSCNLPTAGGGRSRSSSVLGSSTRRPRRCSGSAWRSTPARAESRRSSASSPELVSVMCDRMAWWSSPSVRWPPDVPLTSTETVYGTGRKSGRTGQPGPTRRNVRVLLGPPFEVSGT